MKNILITGYQGLIGSHLVNHFKGKGYFVSGIGRREDFESVVDVLSIDTIIHCAGEIYDETKMFETNINLTYRLLEYIKDHPKVEMVNISSSSIYGKVDYPSSEQNILVPTDIYSATKGAGSLLCVGYAKKYKLKITDVRPYSVYGYGEKPNKLFPNLFNAFSKSVPMILHDGIHDWTYIDDFVDAVEAILIKKYKPFGDIVNIGSGIQTSNFDIYLIFAKCFGFDAQCVTLNHDGYLRERDTQTWCCDNKKSVEVYGINYKYDVETGIFTMLDEFNKNK